MRLTHKLVRNRIPERFPVDESRQIYLKLKPGNATTQQALHDKILEEVNEVVSAGLTHELVDELGDLLTVMQTLAADSGIDWNHILARQSEKSLEWGDFSELNYLVSIKPDYSAEDCFT